MSDATGGIASPRGLDIPGLADFARLRRPLTQYDANHVSHISNEEVLVTRADILVPTALGGVLTPEIARNLQAKAAVFLLVDLRPRKPGRWLGCLAQSTRERRNVVPARGALHGRWATRFLMATAKVLAQRLAALNKETLSIMAQLEKSKSNVRVEDELERLRRRLLTEWTF